MRKRMMIMAALGCLAMATAADAHQRGPAPCGYGAADEDLVVEVARLDLTRWSDLAPA